jgi:hypothetical protein
MTVALGPTYRHPRPRRNYGAPPPRVLSTTIARYCREFEARRGPLWDYFSARVPALYDGEGAALGRERGLRSDGADSLLCVIVALLSSMDIRRGFLGRPPVQPGARWHRRGVRELFGFAFGKPVFGALSIRRIERWLRALASLKVLTTYQLRVKSPRGFESKTAIRHVTDQLFRLAGTHGQLAKERHEAWQAAERERAAHRIESIYIDQKAAERETTAHTNGRRHMAAAVPSTPGSPAPPARAGPEAIRALLKSLNPSNRR